MANNYVNQYIEKRAIDGTGGALYFKLPSESKFIFAFPTEGVPSFRGDTDTHEFSVITSPFKGQTEGQTSLEKKDVTVIWHRDMILRLKEIAAYGEIDILAVAQDYSAEMVTGTITYKRNDLESDTLKGTVTIIPSATETEYIPNCRSLLIETAKFTSTIPDNVVLPANTDPMTIAVTSTDTIEPFPSVVDGATGEDSLKVTAEYDTGILTLTNANTYSASGGTQYVLVILTVNGANKQSWRESIAVTAPMLPQA